MKSLLHTFSLLVLMSCFSLIYPHSAFAADITLPWSTTYNCSEWSRFPDGADTHCDSLTRFGDDQCGTDSPAKPEQITTAANMASGGGGRGQRHWLGDGNNILSGGTNVILNPSQSEIWMRFYMRMPSGFDFGASGPQDYKIIYIDPLTSLRIIIGFYGQALSLYGYKTHYQTLSAPNKGWSYINGGRYGDGLWHCYEAHFKMDTNGTNGIGELWVDGIQLIDDHNANWVNGDGTQIHQIVIGHNSAFPANGRCMPVDFDDIAINNTGYIGPIGSAPSPIPIVPDITPPSTPTNLTATSISSSQINLSWTTSTDNVGIAGYHIYREGTQIATSTTNSYSDTGLTASTMYTYTVDAYDAAGNISGQSSSTSATTQSTTTPGNILFQENFDNNSFASRGWYDVTGGTISTSEHIPGSTSSLECRFLLGGTNCTGGIPGRMAFTATDEVYISYWVKHSSNWQGSGLTKPYHPHIIYFLTNLDGAYTGPAYTYMTAYVEENLGYPILSMQDGKNIDETKIGLNLVGVTENRSTAGCNGTQTGIGQHIVDCYVMGAVHWNGTQWRGSTAYFFNQNEKILWHHVEAYFRLNSVSGGTGQPDGMLRYWYDGQLVIDHNNVIMRTAKNPTMRFNQIMLSPYIGDGSPVDQTFWIDNLTVATSRTSDTMPPSVPKNVR